MDYALFYNIICEVYKKDNNENYNESIINNVDWEDFYNFSNDIFSKFISHFENLEENSDTLFTCANVFNMGYECCDSPMSIPYFYWSDYCWNLLEISTYNEQINILNNLPCIKCRNHSKNYIYDTYVDLVNMKKNINSNQ